MTSTLPSFSTALSSPAALTRFSGFIITLMMVLFLAACGMSDGNLSTEIPNAKGLERGDIVRLNGVDVGNIKSVKLESNGVLVQMNIEKDALKIIDAAATTAVAGGADPYLVIFNPKTTTTPVTKDSVLAASSQHDGLAAGVGSTLSGILGSLQENIENQDWAALSETIEQTTETLTRDGAKLTEALQGTVGSMMEGFEGSMEELEPQINALSEQLANELGDGSVELQQTIESIIGQLANSVAEGIEKGQESQ